MGRVTVIVPCYNHGKYIDEAVDSILNQTYQDFEIIIVDDGSTDAYTVEKLMNYQKPKTRVVHKENRGPGSARDLGIAQALSEYVLTLDADDTFERTFLETAVPILDSQPEIGVVTCGLREFGLRNNTWCPRGGGVVNFLVDNNCVASALFRRRCWDEVGGYGPNPTDYEDWSFWIAITSRGWKVHVIDELLFNYRTSDASRLVESGKKRPDVIRQLVVNHREVFQQNIDDAIYERELIVQQLRHRIKELERDLENSRAGTILKTKLGKKTRLRISLESRQ